MPRNNNKYAGIREASNGTYFVSTSARTKDGYITYITKRGFFNKTEALAYKIAEVQRVQESYKFEQNNQNIKFHDFIDLYVEDYRITNVENSTRQLESLVKNYFKPNIPNLPMSLIKPQHCTKYRSIIAMNESLNSKSKNRRISALRAIFTSAMDKLYLDSKIGRLCLLELTSVADDGHKPKNDYWEVEEYQAFIKSFEDNDRFKLLFQCLFSFACRISEFRAIQFKDLNPKNNTIHIHKQVLSKAGLGKWQIVNRTKTKRERYVTISSKLVQMILNHKQTNNYNDEDFIFFGDKPISENAIYKQKLKHCNLANVKYIKSHDFRHSNITYLLDNNADLKVVASQVGHSNTSTTLDIYNHISQKRTNKLKDILDDMPL